MTAAAAPGPGLIGALALFLVLLALQRLRELRVSSRNQARMRALGGREHGAGHFFWFVLLHGLFPLGLVAEVVFLGARPGAPWPLWLALLLAAQALRFAAMQALGERWSVRIWVLPGAPLVTRGPYRFVRHPNYLAVVAELPAAALLFGAWRTALIFSIANLLILRMRIRAEERALGIGAAAVGPVDRPDAFL